MCHMWSTPFVGLFYETGIRRYHEACILLFHRAMIIHEWIRFRIFFRPYIFKGVKYISNLERGFIQKQTTYIMSLLVANYGSSSEDEDSDNEEEEKPKTAAAASAAVAAALPLPKQSTTTTTNSNANKNNLAVTNNSEISKDDVSCSATEGGGGISDSDEEDNFGGQISDDEEDDHHRAAGNSSSSTRQPTTTSGHGAGIDGDIIGLSGSLYGMCDCV